MGRTACTEPQCLYKGALYLYWCVRKMCPFLITLNSQILISLVTNFIQLGAVIYLLWKRILATELRCRKVFQCNFANDLNFISVALRPNTGHDLLILNISRSHTTT